MNIKVLLIIFILNTIVHSKTIVYDDKIIDLNYELSLENKFKFIKISNDDLKYKIFKVKKNTKCKIVKLKYLECDLKKIKNFKILIDIDNGVFSNTVELLILKSENINKNIDFMNQIMEKDTIIHDLKIENHILKKELNKIKNLNKNLIKKVKENKNINNILENNFF